MRFIVTAVTLVIGGSAAVSFVGHAAGLADKFNALAVALPDPPGLGLLACGFGLIAGARCARSFEVAD